MNKILKNKAFIGGICLLLAAVIAFLVLPSLYKDQKATVLLPKAMHEILPGTVITESMVIATETGAFGLPDRAVRSRTDIIGKVALEPVHAGAYFWQDGLTTIEDYDKLEEERTKGLTDGYCLVTIELRSASAGVAGVLRPGNLVSVHECVENAEDKTYSTICVLENMLVYDVLNDDLESLSEVAKQAAEAEEGSSTTYDLKPVYVVFRCKAAEAQTLIRLEMEESMHLTLQRTEG